VVRSYQGQKIITMETAVEGRMDSKKKTIALEGTVAIVVNVGRI
jgi:hypothetical protein